MYLKQGNTYFINKYKTYVQLNNNKIFILFALKYLLNIDLMNIKYNICKLLLISYKITKIIKSNIYKYVYF